MRQLIESYNELAQQFEEWAFKNFIPPFFKVIELGLKFTLFYAFYLMIKQAISEVF